MFSNQYIRARIETIRSLLQTVRDDGSKNNDHVLLRNGVISGHVLDGKTESDIIADRVSYQADQELRFEEICSFNNWFILHPDKQAGQEIITSSIQFPIAIDGKKEDILQMFAFLFAKPTIPHKSPEFPINPENSPKEKRIRIARARAQALLVLGLYGIDEEANKIFELINENAVNFRPMRFTQTNFQLDFSIFGEIETPIGIVTIDYDQFLKIEDRKRSRYFGLIKPTLKEPILILEHNKRLLFTKSFIDRKKGIIYFFTIAKDNEGSIEIVSNHEKTKSQLIKRIKESNIRYKISSFETPELKGIRKNPKYVAVFIGIPLQMQIYNKKSQNNKKGKKNC